MDDRITNERLREIVDGTYCGFDEGIAIAAELIAARAEVERLRSRVGWLDHLDTPEGRAMHATEAVQVENEQLRAEVARLRNHIDSAGTGFNVALGAIRLSLEQADKDRDALRDDLREAMELLRAYGQPHYWVGLKEAIGWNASYRKLMEKHKETP